MVNLLITDVPFMTPLCTTYIGKDLISTRSVFFRYYNDIYSGLHKDDMPLISMSTKSCKPPTSSEVNNNAQNVKCFRAREERNFE